MIPTINKLIKVTRKAKTAIDYICTITLLGTYIFKIPFLKGIYPIKFYIYFMISYFIKQANHAQNIYIHRRVFDTELVKLFNRNYMILVDLTLKFPKTPMKVVQIFE